MMEAKDLIEYLKTINREEEVTVFDGFKSLRITDIHDAEIQITNN